MGSQMESNLPQGNSNIIVSLIWHKCLQDSLKLKSEWPETLGIIGMKYSLYLKEPKIGEESWEEIYGMGMAFLSNFCSDPYCDSS